MVDSIYDVTASIRWVFDVAKYPFGYFNNLKELSFQERTSKEIAVINAVIWYFQPWLYIGNQFFDCFAELLLWILRTTLITAEGLIVFLITIQQW